VINIINSKKLIFIVWGIIVIMLVTYFLVYGDVNKAQAKACKSENSECHWNNSQHDCCPGLYCNFWKMDRSEMKYKCEAQPTVTPTAYPTTTPTVVPTSTPTVEPTRQPDPTPTPTVEPTSEPTPTPEENKCEGTDSNGHPCGWSPEPYRSEEYKPPVCTAGIPKPASNPTYERQGESVVIRWLHDGTDITKWALTYGYERDNMPMGIPEIMKEAREVTLNGLQNRTVWVSILGFNGNECESYIVFDP
jgi:hypothetical protein